MNIKPRGGQRPGAGRKPGVPNRFTGAFREAVLLAYNTIGGHQSFSQWATQNQTEFYKIAARLIPVELHSEDKQIVVIVDRGCSRMEPPIDVPAIEHQPPASGV